MTDLAAIAAARARGQAAEADALVLADRLVAAKADRARVRTDLAQLPGRITALQQAVAEAQARVAAATEARNGIAAQASVAEAHAENVETTAAAAEDARELAREALTEALQERVGVPAAQKRLFDAERAAVRAREQAQAARSAADAFIAPLAAATSELAAAQAELAAASAQLAAATAQLADARNRQAAVEALPATLSRDIAAQRTRVTTAWQPWDALLVAAHSAIAAAAAQVASASSPAQAAAASAEFERLRAELVAGDSADDLTALVATELPLALLPVRLETRFDATNLLVRIYPDSVHVDAHEPELTADELAWGRAYLERERTAGVNSAAALESWRALVDRFGAPRAAWIARAAAADAPPQQRRRLDARGADERPPRSLDRARLPRRRTPLRRARAADRRRVGPRPRPQRPRCGRPGSAARAGGAVARRLRPRRRAGHGAANSARRGRPRRPRPAPRARRARDRRRHRERAPPLGAAGRPPLHRRARAHAARARRRTTPRPCGRRGAPRATIPP